MIKNIAQLKMRHVHKLTLVMQVRYLCNCSISRFQSLSPERTLRHTNTVALTRHFMYPSAPTIVATSTDEAAIAVAKVWSKGRRKKILGQIQPQTSVRHGCVSNSSASS